MRALVVYESMFGNTQSIADAIAAGLACYGSVEMHEVGQAPMRLPDDVDILVVGAPTHAFGLSRPSTRRDAATHTSEPVISAQLGVREWLEELPRPPRRIAAAGFDTKLGQPAWLPGSAARAINKRLRRLGFSRAAMPTSFYVGSITGPLTSGELTRAKRWGQTMAETSLATHPDPAHHT